MKDGRSTSAPCTRQQATSSAWASSAVPDPIWLISSPPSRVPRSASLNQALITEYPSFQMTLLKLGGRVQREKSLCLRSRPSTLRIRCRRVVVIMHQVTQVTSLGRSLPSPLFTSSRCRSGVVRCTLWSNSRFRIRNNTYTLPITRQIGACIARGFLRLQNNYAPGLAGVIANFILSLVIGSIYFDLDDSTASLDKRAVLLFFSLMNSAFSPAFEVRPHNACCRSCPSRELQG